MNRMKWCFASGLGLAAVVASAAMAADPAPAKRWADKLLYTLDKPADGWAKPAFDTKGWKEADSLKAILSNLAEPGRGEIWFRLEKSLVPEEINNLFYRARHSGTLEIFVNGERKFAGGDSPGWRDCLVSPMRDEVPGRNVYGFHYAHAGGGPVFFELRAFNPPWILSEGRMVMPDPVLPDLIRDAQVCLGGDGNYYMTGTTGDEAFHGMKTTDPKDKWLRNPGIQVFRSPDLKRWTSLGYVWTFERDGTWNKDTGTFSGRGPARGIFAPEIHFLKGKYWLAYSVNHTTPSHTFGIGLLRADKPEGPWTEMSPDKPITDGFDANLFQDDDGTVYLLKHGGEIARMKDDMTGVAEPFRPTVAENFPRIGYEGVYLFKHNGKYVLTAAEWNRHADGLQTYDSAVAVSDKVYGPYGKRHTAIRCGGHGGYFKTKDGAWHATVWEYPMPEARERVTITKVSISPDFMIRPEPASGFVEDKK